MKGTDKLCHLLLRFEKSLRLSPYENIEKEELLDYSRIEKRFVVENSLVAIGNVAYYNLTSDISGGLILLGLLVANSIRWMTKYRM